MVTGLRSLMVIFAAVILAGALPAVDSAGQTPLYKRHEWGADQGFPGGPVRAIAQTADGYLWIGSDKGLFRFDGFEFAAFSPANRIDAPAGAIEALTTDSAGSLWILDRHLTLWRYANGKFETVPGKSMPGDNRVTAICRSNTGQLLLLQPSRGVMQYGAGGLSTVLITSAVPNFLVISMAQTVDGIIWLGTRDAGLFAFGPDHKLTSIEASRDWKINTLLPVGNDKLWVGTDNGRAIWNGTALTVNGFARNIGAGPVFAMLQDHRSNIWISSTRDLVSVDRAGAALWKQARDVSASTIHAIFEDREANIWLGTDGGLTRLRESPFSSTQSAAASAPDRSSPVYVDEQGRAWSSGEDDHLMWEKAGQREHVRAAGLDKDVVLSIDGGHDAVWVGRRRGGLTQLRREGGSFRATTYTHRQGLAQDSVYSVFQSLDGSVWAGTLTAGVSRLRNGRFTTYTTAHGLASDTINTIAETTDGAMWFGTPKGLSEFSSEGWRNYAGREGLPPGGVTCIFADQTGTIWIGTPRGLGFLRSGHFQSTWDPRGVLQGEILGIAEDRSHWLWITTTSHVVRVNGGSLLSGSLKAGDFEEFGPADGLAGTAGVNRSRSIVCDAAGRIWVSTNRGISVVNPAWLNVTPRPVLAHIQGVSADNNVLGADDAITIPANRKRITIRYVGLSLADPERVKLRYKLDAFDRDWTDAQSAREAVYTNLGPGSYDFHVKANEAYGTWDSPEAMVRLQVEAAFWQAWWFRLSMGLAALLLARLVYETRLKQVSNRLKLRYEERLAERTRIAQELHDTLLQGFLSASMQLHVAQGRLGSDSPAMPPLQRAIELIDQAGREGRTTLRGLRSSQGDLPDLEKVFSCLPLELGSSDTMAFRVIVVGPQRTLKPELRDEVYRIGREAVLNAFRHSQGKHVEMELDYSEGKFQLVVRDDGTGIDEHLLESGLDGHWGLTGMRERAQTIGGHLSFWSSAAAGTEVVLAIPAHIAYQAQPPGGSRRWIRALFPKILKNYN